MLFQNEFISMSLELNLFFLRIMKEHSFFLESSFTPRDAKMAAEARVFKQEFERLLSEATDLANGTITEHSITSRQFVSQYTVDAERQTSYYTGMPFNINLTQRELKLTAGNQFSPDMEQRVDSINRRAHRLTSNFAEYKNKVYQNVKSCKAFTHSYPHMIEHMMEEAKHYLEMLEHLITRRESTEAKDLINEEVFWNHKMAMHAKFIAGLLDPTEETLIITARMFAEEFDKLTDEAKAALISNEIKAVTEESLNATERLRAFKATGTEGILSCKIESMIIPLLADHVLREANHYLCILGKCSSMIHT